ncbi:MAG: 7-cyano-7-deazaguanine synthase QueC [Moraxellaceae bacterium]|nr:7-cyano-7-deazaguanine synthase QueC [Moraxellaceae bacterium]HQV41260.1 7-cyano-7-deazaguanine synthase QueC [Moraxellaceae bacterium]HQX90710.1 7-cyano-7-deazaguanine synthase QueC [Moraxellaceae bacterium]
MTTLPKAIILLSGGLDSATCLAIARHEGFEPVALSFDYGQRHNAELVASRRVAEAFAVRDHRVLRLELGTMGGSALTDSSIEIPTQASEGIPVTYVPARNTVFLSFALGLAEVVGADAIFIGVNSVDYSGYPDCRPEFIDAFETMANLATKAGVEGHHMKIHTPLMHLTKAEIVQTGMALGVDYALTVSCYQADSEGSACGVCDSCRLRRKGFEDAGVPDPTRYQAA